VLPAVASSEDAGVQTKEPLLGMPTTMGGPKGTLFSDGPLRRMMDRELAVVGVQVMVNGLQAGMTWCCG
jgi:hypothetical protein